VPQSQTVRFSDTRTNRILQFDPASGQGSVFRADAEYTNGRTLDLEQRVLQCSHGRRAIEREDAAGPTIVVDRWGDGVRFNSPNDLVVARDGSIWFTDPPYGILPGTDEGHEAPQEYDGCFVFRFADGVAEPVVTSLVYPNGLAFSPDESVLYIADTGAEHGNPIHQWRDGQLSLFKDLAQGQSDGFRVDAAGRIWTSAGEHVVVLDPDGDELVVVPVPEPVSNVCFGGPDGTDLYITATSSLYRLRTDTVDAAQHW
jgi:gluconolactonase